MQNCNELTGHQPESETGLYFWSRSRGIDPPLFSDSGYQPMVVMLRTVRLMTTDNMP